MVTDSPGGESGVKEPCVELSGAAVSGESTKTHFNLHIDTQKHTDV